MTACMIQRGSVIALALFLASVVGCATQNAELPPQANQDLTTLRDYLVQGKAQIQTTCNAARDLTTRPQSQLQPQVDRLVQSISRLENIATDNRQQFASAEERALAYFAHWDKQMEGMSKSLALSGQERRDKSMRSFEELKSRADSLRQEFRPFMKSLTEVSRYLQTDTTAAGVKAVTPQITSALDVEKKLMAKADAVIEQIDAMRGGK